MTKCLCTCFTSLQSKKIPRNSIELIGGNDDKDSFQMLAVGQTSSLVTTSPSNVRTAVPFVSEEMEVQRLQVVDTRQG
jgi:hypothetical protein